MMIQELKQYLMNEIDADRWDEETLPLRHMMACYSCAIMELETKFRVLYEEFSLNYDKNPIETIHTRLKSESGIARKLKKRNLPMTLKAIEENIFDVAGLRVICAFPEDVYLVEKCLLAQDDIRLIKRKDYIKDPKPSGYRSLHLIVEIPIFLADQKKWVKAEIQLRTLAMDFWASLEHKLRYKKNLDEEVEKAIKDSLIKAADTCYELDLQMEAVRSKIKKISQYQSGITV